MDIRETKEQLSILTNHVVNKCIMAKTIFNKDFKFLWLRFNAKLKFKINYSIKIFKFNSNSKVDSKINFLQ